MPEEKIVEMKKEFLVRFAMGIASSDGTEDLIQNWIPDIKAVERSGDRGFRFWEVMADVIRQCLEQDIAKAEAAQDTADQYLRKIRRGIRVLDKLSENPSQ